MDDKNMQALMDALDNHQVTDESGETQAEEQTANEDTSAHEEQAPVTETATAEKPEKVEVEAPKPPTEADSDLAEDEAGKRYVPEGRFKEVYAKQKQLERELAMAKAQANPLTDVLPKQTQPSQPLQAVDQTAALEVELLKTTLPQFDPNNSEQYSPELDELGVTIYNANLTYDAKGKATPGITRIEAARRAIAQARKFTQNQIAIATEARKVKSIQSDQGITNRVVSRQDTANVPPTDASDQEIEAYLKANGQW